MPRETAGKTPVMELKREPGMFGKAKVEVTLVCNMLNRGNNPHGDTMCVVNTNLKRSVDIAKTLYCYSRIARVLVQYNLESLNCDVMLSFLVSDDPVWVKKNTRI